MAETKVRMAFERRVMMLKLSVLLPLRQVPDRIKQSTKYKRIAKSIAEIGVIEPLAVARSKQHPGRYLLLDGHVRLSVLTDLGQSDVRCLIADDDEAFTYNKRVNRLATVQEHFMIVRALDRGVSEEKLARALNVDMKLIRRRRTLLDGITPEVIDLLKDKAVNPSTFDMLRRMKPMRQYEAADLMVTVGNYSSSYAKALLAATKQTDLVKPERAKKIAGLTPEQMARMEREMETLQQDFKSIEASYGDDVLHLVIASGYLGKLIGNANVERYLATHHAEVLTEFRTIIAAGSLDHSHMAA